MRRVWLAAVLLSIAALAAKRGKVFAVTYNYTGYPLMRQARQMIEQGKLGKIRKVTQAKEKPAVVGWFVRAHRLTSSRIAALTSAAVRAARRVNSRRNLKRIRALHVVLLAQHARGAAALPAKARTLQGPSLTSKSEAPKIIERMFE